MTLGTLPEHDTGIAGHPFRLLRVTMGTDQGAGKHN